MLFLFTILPLIALFIKFDSPGPLFFFQTRVGRYGKKFQFIKFRTMEVNAHTNQWELDMFNETAGLTFKMKNDPRITRVGKVLRKTSLDELPQLWSILLGHMSLVGPRPPLLKEFEHYDSKQNLRMTVPQGLTGLWQVRGRSTLGFDDMVDLDVKYALHTSYWLDLKIILYTIPTVLLGRGAK